MAPTTKSVPVAGRPTRDDNRLLACSSCQAPMRQYRVIVSQKFRGLTRYLRCDQCGSTEIHRQQRSIEADVDRRHAALYRKHLKQRRQTKKASR